MILFIIVTLCVHIQWDYNITIRTYYEYNNIIVHNKLLTFRTSRLRNILLDYYFRYDKSTVVSAVILPVMMRLWRCWAYSEGWSSINQVQTNYACPCDYSRRYTHTHAYDKIIIYTYRILSGHTAELQTYLEINCIIWTILLL